MKFGETFAASRHPQWRCIDYDALKALLKTGTASAVVFAAALYDEVMAVDMSFIRLRANCDGSDEYVEALRSHAVLNYIAVLKIQKKAYKRIHGGKTDLQDQDGWSDLLRASFCEALLISSLFIDAPSGAKTEAEDGRSDEGTGCPVCLQCVVLSTLPCGHGVCTSCLAHCASAGLGSCPLCRAPCTLDPACARVEAILGVGPSLAKKYEPASALAPPSHARADGARNRKVLLVAIDGCRPDALLWANTPSIRAVLEDGAAYSFHARCGPVSLSGPSWASVFSGLSPAEHGVHNNAPHQLGMSDVGRHSSLFARVKRVDPHARTKLVSAATWGGVDAILGPDSDERCWLDGADEASTAQQATGAICESLLRFEGARTGDGDGGDDAACPDVTVLYMHHIDAVGHKGGFAPHLPAYRAAIEAVDACVGELHEAVRKRMSAFGEDWLLLLTTDHGGTARAFMPADMQSLFDRNEAFQQGAPQTALQGIHGLDIDQHRQVFVIGACASHLAPGEMLPEPSHQDIVPTILHHLAGMDAGMVTAAPPQQHPLSPQALAALTAGCSCGGCQPFAFSAVPQKQLRAAMRQPLFDSTVSKGAIDKSPQSAPEPECFECEE